MSTHNDLGKKGEEAAQHYLREQAYRILHINWRCRRAEVDIIALDADTLVFVEVKTRSTDRYGCPTEAVSAHKQSMLYEAAEAFLVEYDLQNELRFDVVAVLWNAGQPIVQHFKEAF
jgi:putative endonuclease